VLTFWVECIWLVTGLPETAYGSTHFQGVSVSGRLHAAQGSTHYEGGSASSIFYIYKNGRTDVCLFVCLLVCGWLVEIQTPAPILMKFCTYIPTYPRKVLVQF